jgi:peptide/nickel transport system substrate-binding protein
MRFKTILQGFAVCLLLLAQAVAESQLRFCLHSDPKTFNPLIVDDDASETVRYLTGGVLVRLNRRTQELEPELATSWKTSADGKSITFMLRRGVQFSDGSPFDAADIDFTMKSLMNPDLHSPTGDAFRSGRGQLTAVVHDNKVTITFPAPVASLDKLFDQVAIMSSRSPLKERATLGPFALSDYKPGVYVLLHRNQHYWKKDEAGQQLPYIDSIRLDIEQNRELELNRFRRGEIQLINAIDSTGFDQLQAESQFGAIDAGPSLDSEEMWFNQVPNAPIPTYKREWFQSQKFRQAISSAIHRDDLVRIVFHRHAVAATGPVSPANHFWFSSNLKPLAFDPAAAMKLLTHDGFRLVDGALKDRTGNPVEFSILTNSGNKSRLQMAAMIQQDLSSIGIKVNIVTLDFPSLIERMTHSISYEACLLGLVNTDLDPNSQMNIWLSSGQNHQWNPAQKTPATAWEAELDRLMRAQASTTNLQRRKQIFDQVQEIISQQQPFIYLVHKNSLSAISPKLRGTDAVALSPQTYWNIERISMASERAAK